MAACLLACWERRGMPSSMLGKGVRSGLSMGMLAGVPQPELSSSESGVRRVARSAWRVRCGAWLGLRANQWRVGLQRTFMKCVLAAWHNPATGPRPTRPERPEGTYPVSSLQRFSTQPVDRFAAKF